MGWAALILAPIHSQEIRKAVSFEFEQTRKTSEQRSEIIKSAAYVYVYEGD